MFFENEIEKYVKIRSVWKQNATLYNLVHLNFGKDKRFWLVLSMNHLIGLPTRSLHCQNKFSLKMPMKWDFGISTKSNNNVRFCYLKTNWPLLEWLQSVTCMGPWTRNSRRHGWVGTWFWNVFTSTEWIWTTNIRTRDGHGHWLNCSDTEIRFRFVYASINRIWLNWFNNLERK